MSEGLEEEAAAQLASPKTPPSAATARTTESRAASPCEASVSARIAGGRGALAMSELRGWGREE